MPQSTENVFPLQVKRVIHIEDHGLQRVQLPIRRESVHWAIVSQAGAVKKCSE